MGSSFSLAGGKQVEVAKITVHPDYETIHNDIAIMELVVPLTFTEKIKAVPLVDEKFELKSGAIATVTGFGVTDKQGYKNTLEMAEVPIIENNTCNQYYGGLIKEYMICAGYKEGGTDSCQVNLKWKMWGKTLLHFVCCREIQVVRW